MFSDPDSFLAEQRMHVLPHFCFLQILQVMQEEHLCEFVHNLFKTLAHLLHISHALLRAHVSHFLALSWCDFKTIVSVKRNAARSTNILSCIFACCQTFYAQCYLDPGQKVKMPQYRIILHVQYTQILLAVITKILRKHHAGFDASF